jgi:hypothetical protein
MRGHLGRFLLLGVLVLALPGGAQAAPSWLAPVTLDGPTPNVGADLPTAVAMNDRGDTVVAWPDYQTQGDAVEANDTTQVVAVYRRAGGSFGSPQPLQATPAHGLVPSVKAGIAADGSAVVAFSTLNSPTSARIQVASSGPSGTFGAARDVTGPAEDSAVLTDMDVSAAGAVALVYEQAGKLRGATGTVAGPVTPLASELVTGAYSGTGRVAIDPAGDAVWAWERDVAGPRYLVEVRDKPAGQGLKAAVTVTPNADNSLAENPAITIGADGRAVVAYGYREGVIPEAVRYNARSAPSGDWGAGTWNLTSGLVSKSGQVTGSFGTQIGILPANTTIATYAAADNTVWVASRISGQQFAAHQALTDAGAGAYNQQLAVSGNGSAVVAFEGPGSVQAAVLAPGATQFGATQEDVDVLGGSGFDSDAYTDGTPVATDAHGNAITAYSISRCPTGCAQREVLIRASLFDAEAPRLGEPSIPAEGIAGTPLAFSVSALDVASAFTTNWSFGDGQSATGTSVAHAYAGPGTYTATVTTTDAVGNVSSRSGVVQVRAAPVSVPDGATPPPVKIATTVKVGTTVRARWDAQKRFARLLEMTVARVPEDSTVRITCAGKGCPFAKAKTLRFKKAKKVEQIAKLFTRKVRKKRLPAQLRVGAKVTVEISTATAIGRWFAFTIRPKSIKPENGCLAPGARRHVGC